ncbi:hypothetical protein BEP19_08380 [Ammoniphilus oxalaticus]|uniref:Uncharacterized protein n=1 Tax=Ammoniphilus oxalaticus TaxID=66863 RepID=A0A419SKG3_9BACL|nr:ankyrin repeat domain-containing protein [Ammoniphilus oxalaticus]RKD24398.1 hypothetical protein BEP19_08380 [Ammoniphilus oxalaticus]
MQEDHLTELVRRNNISEIIVHLDKDINQVNGRGDSVLLIATRLNYRSLVDQLINLGADINHENHRGTSALTLAIFNGFFEMARDLWISGAKVVRPSDKEADSSNLVHTMTYKQNLRTLEEQARKEATDTIR